MPVELETGRIEAFSDGVFAMLAIALLFSALWGPVARDRRLVHPEVSEVEVNAILLASSPNIGFYGGALAIVAPRAAAFAYLLIAVVSVLRVRGDEVPAEAT